MTRKQHFAEFFWDIDFKGSTGFEVLVKKFKDGRQMCKDFEDFLRQRARIEENYSKELHKLSRTPAGSTEMGGLRVSWDSMKSHLDKISQEHNELSRAINEAATRVGEFKETQKKDFKKEESNVKACITKKLDQLKKTQDSKKVFEKASSDAEQIKMQVKSATSSGQTRGNPADMSKLYNKQVKAEEEADNLDHTYKDNLARLNQIRMQWETNMIAACNVFEKLEEQRIEFLRNELWAHLNVQSQTYIRNDENNEEVRLRVERCDPDTDIVKFINEKRTGTTRPAEILYDANNRQNPPRPHGVKIPTPQSRQMPQRFVQPAAPQSGRSNHQLKFTGPSVMTFRK